MPKKKVAKKTKAKFNREKFEKAGWVFTESKLSHGYRTSPDCFYKSPRMDNEAFSRVKFDDPTFTDKMLLELEFERFCSEMKDKAIEEYYDYVLLNIKENYKPLTI